MLKDYFDKLYRGGREDFFRLADEALDQGRRLFVVTANPEVMMIAQADPEMDAALCAPSATIIADGIGVVKAAHGLGLSTVERIPGVELAQELLRRAGESGKRVYLYGAKEEVVQALAARLRRETPAVQLVGVRNGYGGDDEGVFADVLRQQPDLVLVALGVGRQEKLIARWLARFDKGVFIGVGGSFDVLSGMKERAPDFFLKHNLEWLYRITKEPKRLGRFARSNLRFFGQVRRIGR